MNTEHQHPPCKTFNKKKAITCYQLRFDINTGKFNHFELYRIINKTHKEYYVLSSGTLQKVASRHLSYHKSGAFHWREEDGRRIVPSDGESDLRRASLVSQAVKYLSGELDGYCIFKGKNVTDDSLSTMIKIMDGYIIPSLNDLGVAETLIEKKSVTISMDQSPYKILKNTARQIFEEANISGTDKKITKENLIYRLQKQFGDSVKISFLDQNAKYFTTTSPETMKKIIPIARYIVKEKFKDNPPGFWTKDGSETF